MQTLTFFYRLLFIFFSIGEKCQTLLVSGIFLRITVYKCLKPWEFIALALDLVDYTYPIYVALFRAHYTPIILGLRYARESKQSEQENKQRKHLEGHRYDHQVDHEREKCLTVIIGLSWHFIQSPRWYFWQFIQISQRRLRQGLNYGKVGSSRLLVKLCKYLNASIKLRTR